MMKKKVGILIATITLFIGAGGMYLLMYFFPVYANGDTIVNKLEKEVTVTDAGISDAVEKLYDAVVMVQVYKSNTKYGSGTGFVYKSEGNKAYILTNNHVVDGAEKVTVILSNEEEIEVKVLGKDLYNDLAVLTIDSNKILAVAKIGDSTALKLGDTLFTIGAPLDNRFFGTVTRGIVSGLDRMVEVSVANSYSNDYIMRVIQTDASINSGNSGGPLANSNGEVIGITSLKLVSSGVEGMGFAIPIEDAIEYATLLEEGKELIRPYLGVSMYDVTSNFGQGSIKIPESITDGVIIQTVEKSSPAAIGGLQANDVVRKINGISIKNMAELKYQLYKHTVGDTITLTINRDGSEKTLTIKLSKKAS